MKWFKHDTDASMDAKLQEVMLDYGLEGYGLYWYCIELIAGKVDAENLTFSLEHDARIIARNTGSTAQKVTEMMTRFVDLGLFQNNDGLITCLRLAKRLNKSMTSNPEMRKAIEAMNKNHDSIMTQSGLIMQEENRTEENRTDKEKEVNQVQASPKPSKNKFSDRHLMFAEAMYSRFLESNESFKKPNLESWANTIRLAIESDKRAEGDLWAVFDWANRNSFWCSNILSASKLRDKYDQLLMQMKSESTRQQSSDFTGQQSVTNWAEGLENEFHGVNK